MCIDLTIEPWKGFPSIQVVYSLLMIWSIRGFQSSSLFQWVNINFQSDATGFGDGGVFRQCLTHWIWLVTEMIIHLSESLEVWHRSKVPTTHVSWFMFEHNIVDLIPRFMLSCHTKHSVHDTLQLGEPLQFQVDKALRQAKPALIAKLFTVKMVRGTPVVARNIHLSSEEGIVTWTHSKPDSTRNDVPRSSLDLQVPSWPIHGGMGRWSN